MTLDEAIEVLTSSLGKPSGDARDNLHTAKEMAIDALSAIKNIRVTCGACLPFALHGETPPDELK